MPDERAHRFQVVQHLLHHRGSHLVSMRMASSASAGFSRMSPSISTTCNMERATILETAALSLCHDRN